MSNLALYKGKMGVLLNSARRLSFAVCSENNVPQVSLMQFVVDSEFKIYMKYFNSSRKHSNLLSNKSAGICVYDKKNYAQIEGNVVILDNSEVIGEVKKLFIDKYGGNVEEIQHLNSYLNDKNLVFVRFDPESCKIGVRKDYLFEFENLF